MTIEDYMVNRNLERHPLWVLRLFEAPVLEKFGCRDDPDLNEAIAKDIKELVVKNQLYDLAGTDPVIACVGLALKLYPASPVRLEALLILLLYMELDPNQNFKVGIWTCAAGPFLAEYYAYTILCSATDQRFDVGFMLHCLYSKLCDENVAHDKLKAIFIFFEPASVDCRHHRTFSRMEGTARSPLVSPYRATRDEASGEEPWASYALMQERNRDFYVIPRRGIIDQYPNYEHLVTRMRHVLRQDGLFDQSQPFDLSMDRRLARKRILGKVVSLTMEEPDFKPELWEDEFHGKLQV